MRRLLAWPLLALACLRTAAAATALLPVAAPPAMLCRPAMLAAAQAHGIPPGLMLAVGQVESGRRDPATGAVSAWPWTVDADGQGAFYDSAAQAIGAVQTAQAQGVRSVDVGCMQVNLLHHPTAFASLAQAFDPMANANYAAGFLHDLFLQGGSWPKAAALYHSATPEVGADYQRKVMALWSGDPTTAPTPRFGLVSATGANLAPFAVPPPRRQAAGARIIPMPQGADGAVAPGRGLAAYRAAPIMTGLRRFGR